MLQINTCNGLLLSFNSTQIAVTSEHLNLLNHRLGVISSAMLSLKKSFLFFFFFPSLIFAFDLRELEHTTRICVRAGEVP